MSGVDQIALADVCLAQEGEVDGGDAAQVEGEEKHVAGEVQFGLVAQVGFFDAADFFHADGALCGFVDAGVDWTEGVAVLGEPGGNCFVVNGADDTQIKGGGVAAEVLSTEPGFVGQCKLWGEGIEGEIAVVAESHQVVQGLDVVGCRAESACFL